MSKLTVELIQAKLLKEEEDRKVKVANLKQPSNRGPHEIGKVTFTNEKPSSVDQVEVPANKKLGSAENKDFIPTAEMAGDYVDDMGHMGMSKAENEKSPKGPSVKSLTPNQTQHQKEVKNTIKNTEEGSNAGKTSLPAAKDASYYVDKQPHGLAKPSSESTPEVKAPKAKDLGATTKGKTTTVNTNFADKDNKKVAQIKVDGGFSNDPSDAMNRKVGVEKAKGSSTNVVESGVVVKVGNKTKTVLEVASKRVLRSLVETYKQHGYTVTFERTNDVAWKKDDEFRRLLGESIHAAANYLPESAAKLRKAALNRFHSLVKESYNSLYESKEEFTKTVVEAFKKIESGAQKRYDDSLELMLCNGRLIEGRNQTDFEVVLKATDPQMALRQVRHKIAESHGLGANIKHIFVDGVKYTPDQIQDWAPKSL